VRGNPAATNLAALLKKLFAMSVIVGGTLSGTGTIADACGTASHF
jgi:hypothetical protein